MPSFLRFRHPTRGVEGAAPYKAPNLDVGATLAVALTLTGRSRTIHTHKLKLVRRSLDSLRSLGMTVGVVLCKI